MKYTKHMFAKELIKKLNEQPFDVIKISKWCNRVYMDHLSEMDDDLYSLIFELSTMEDDPQFEYTEKELKELATKLIFEGEKEELSMPILEIKDKAEDLGDNWLMCPLCQEAWQSQSEHGMVLCPQCGNKLHNPQFRAN